MKSRSIDQSFAKMLLDGFVAVLAIGGVLGAVVLSTAGHSVLAGIVFLVGITSAITVHRWLDEHS